jgi:hypothetical protein
VDIQDVVDAHLLAWRRAPQIGFRRYLISATTPFLAEDLPELRLDASRVVRRRVPGYEAEYARLGWRMFPSIGRVEVNRRVREELGWQPRYDFKSILDRLAARDDLCSPLARAIGSKGTMPTFLRMGRILSNKWRFILLPGASPTQRAAGGGWQNKMN